MAAKFSVAAQMNELERQDAATEDVMQLVWAHGGLMKKRLSRSMIVLTLLIAINLLTIPFILWHSDDNPAPLIMGFNTSKAAGLIQFNAVLILGSIGFMSYGQLLARYYVVSRHRATLVSDLAAEKERQSRIKDKSSSKRKNRKIE